MGEPQKCWACGCEIPPGQGVQRTITTRRVGVLWLPVDHTEAVRFCAGCAQRQLETEQAEAEAKAERERQAAATAERERQAALAKSGSSGCLIGVAIFVAVASVLSLVI